MVSPAVPSTSVLFVLAGTAAFLAAFLVGRVVSLRYWTARKAIHLDMKRRD